MPFCLVVNHYGFIRQSTFYADDVDISSLEQAVISDGDHLIKSDTNIQIEDHIYDFDTKSFIPVEPPESSGTVPIQLLKEI